MNIKTVKELIEALKELPDDMQLLYACEVRTATLNGCQEVCHIDTIDDGW